MKNIDRVMEFHETYKCAIGQSPTLKDVSPEAFILRMNLIREETGELMSAYIYDDVVEILDALTDLEYVIDGTFITFGFDEDLDYKFGSHNVLDEVIGQPIGQLMVKLDYYVAELVECYQLRNFWEKNLLYDNTKFALHMLKAVLGVCFHRFDMQAVREDAGIEVHRSNMSKLGEDGRPIYRENDGKVLKGPNYSPPNLGQFVNA